MIRSPEECAHLAGIPVCRAVRIERDALHKLRLSLELIDRVGRPAAYQELSKLRGRPIRAYQSALLKANKSPDRKNER